MKNCHFMHLSSLKPVAGLFYFLIGLFYISRDHFNRELASWAYVHLSSLPFCTFIENKFKNHRNFIIINILQKLSFKKKHLLHWPTILKKYKTASKRDIFLGYGLFHVTSPQKTGFWHPCSQHGCHGQGELTWNDPYISSAENDGGVHFSILVRVFELSWL